MITINRSTRAAVLLGLTAFLASAVVAMTQTTTPAQSPTASVASTSHRINSVPLPYGVADVLKLAHAGISDDTIIAFIASNHSQYGLGASEILSLKDQGISDHVLSAMLQNGKTAAATAAPTPAAAPVTYSAPPVVYSPPAQTTYVQPAPAEPAAATVYVFGSPQPTYVYPNYYYPTYGTYYYPPVTFGFGFGAGYGGYYRGGCYYRGNRGGGYYGGGYSGYHGGGSSGGGSHVGGSAGHHR